jgi:hypothetical protein
MSLTKSAIAHSREEEGHLEATDPWQLEWQHSQSAKCDRSQPEKLQIHFMYEKRDLLQERLLIHDQHPALHALQTNMVRKHKRKHGLPRKLLLYISTIQST